MANGRTGEKSSLPRRLSCAPTVIVVAIIIIIIVVVVDLANTHLALVAVVAGVGEQHVAAVSVG